MDVGGYLDKGIYLDYPEGYPTEVIWGDLMPQEAELLSDALLQWGTHNTYVAEAIRTAIDWKDYAAILAILSPRMQKTFYARRNAPRRDKKAKRGGLSIFRKEDRAG